MPNPLELTAQERKGLLYGSLLSAALTAATAALKGQNILPSVLSGTTAGLGSYGGGMERVIGYKEAQSAEKRRQAQEARQQRAFEQEQSLFPLQRQALEAKIAHIPEQEAFMQWQRENYPQKKTPPLPKKQPNKPLVNIPQLPKTPLQELIEGFAPQPSPQILPGGGFKTESQPTTTTKGLTIIDRKTGKRMILKNGKWQPLN